LKTLEEEVLLPLIFHINPRDPRAAGIAERVRRSMDPSLAKDERDRRAREAKRQRVLASFFRPESEEGVFPGAERREGDTGEALKLRAEALGRVAEKITRVVLFDRYGQYVEPGRRVATYVVPRGPAVQRIGYLIEGGEVIEVPPGIRVAIRRAEDDRATVMALVDLWGHYQLFTSIMPPDVAGPSEALETKVEPPSEPSPKVESPTGTGSESR
jgi:hypothetical protein